MTKLISKSINTFFKEILVRVYICVSSAVLSDAFFKYSKAYVKSKYFSSNILLLQYFL